MKTIAVLSGERQNTCHAERRSLIPMYMYSTLIFTLGQVLTKDKYFLVLSNNETVI